MSFGQPLWATEFATLALHGQLAIYTGAGLSRGEPSGIPLGGEVAKRCFDRLIELLPANSLDGADPSDLTSVADAVSKLERGAELVRRTAVEVAPFTTARPNFGHQVLAMLLLEGSVVVFTTNWDDCIERSGLEEHILTVISDQDRQEVQTAALLKVHGCATRPTTALITSEDLTDPPAWARDAVHSRLANSHLVFVGIGDIAGYVRSRISEASSVVKESEIFVVSPTARSSWNGSGWAEVLPDLPTEHLIEESADEFLDHLAGAYVRLALREISEALSDDSPVHTQFNVARLAFDSKTSLEALYWLRACALTRQPGKSVIQEQSFTHAMIALGALGCHTLALPHAGRALANDQSYDVIVGVGIATLSVFEREAVARLVRFRTGGGHPSAEPTFLVAGVQGRRAVNTGDLEEDILDDSAPDDLIGGPLSVRPRLVHAEDVAA